MLRSIREFAGFGRVGRFPGIEAELALAPGTDAPVDAAGSPGADHSSADPLQASTTHMVQSARAGDFDHWSPEMWNEGSAADSAARWPSSTPKRRPIFDTRWLVARLVRLVPRASFGAAFLMLVVALGLFGLRSVYEDRIYPRLAVGDVPVGGMEQEDARSVLEQRAAALEHDTFTFTYEDQTWTPTLAELGASVDIDASIAVAYDVGREEHAVTRMRSTSDLFRDSQVVPLKMRLDRAALTAWFDQVDAELDRPYQNAALVVEGTTVSIEPELEGVVIDRERAERLVVSALVNLEPIVEPLPVVAQSPAVNASDLEAARQHVESALAQGIRVSFEDRRWSLAPADLARFVVQDVDPDKTGPEAVILDLDQPALTAWLSEQFAETVRRDPVDARVGWNDGLVALSASVDGIQLRPNTFAKQITASFFGDHDAVEIPVSVTKPEIDSNNLDALGITTLLGRGDSNYAGGTRDRDHNIEVGVSLLNGTLVPPGAEFSFNGAIGEITPDKGYVEAAVIVAERVGRDVGGGICQVTTTVFRAALLAGLPITAWDPHSYRLENYERDGWGPGFDASILQYGDDPSKWSDFRFQNPSEDAWLLVEAWVTGVHVVVNIYGPDLGYEVQFSDAVVEGPIKVNTPIEIVNPNLPAGTIQQTEWPSDGWAVYFTREVSNAKGEQLYSREFYTPYHARGNVYQVSPDMRGQSPGG